MKKSHAVQNSKYEVDMGKGHEPSFSTCGQSLKKHDVIISLVKEQSAMYLKHAKNMLE